MSHYSKILIRPVVTEKMTALQETENKYAFEVPVNINKIDIKKAVEEKFNVKYLKLLFLIEKAKQSRWQLKVMVEL